MRYLASTNSCVCGDLAVPTTINGSLTPNACICVKNLIFIDSTNRNCGCSVGFVYSPTQLKCVCSGNLILVNN